MPEKFKFSAGDQVYWVNATTGESISDLPYTVITPGDPKSEITWEGASAPVWAVNANMRLVTETFESDEWETMDAANVEFLTANAARLGVEIRTITQWRKKS